MKSNIFKVASSPCGCVPFGAPSSHPALSAASCDDRHSDQQLRRGAWRHL